MSPGEPVPNVAETRRRLPGDVSLHLAGLVVIVALVVGGVVALSSESVLLGDRALLEMRVRQVFGDSVPLVGAYSRFGWSHLGPWLFYLYAVPYRLAGGDGVGLAAAAAVVNAALLGCTAWLAARHSAETFLITVLATTVLLANGTISLADPWNAAAVVVPLLAVLVAAVASSGGSDVALAVLIGAAALAVHTHVGMAAVVGAVGVVGIAGWVRGRSTGRLPRAAFVVGSLAVLPLAIDTIVDWPGNTWRLVRFAATDETSQVGSIDAARLVLRSASPEFVVAPGYDQFFGFVVRGQSVGWLPGALLVAVGVIARFGSAASTRTFARLALVAYLGALVGIAAVRGPLNGYLLAVLPVLASVGWSIVAVDLLIRSSLRPHLINVGVAAVLLWPIAVVVAADGPWLDSDERSDIVAVDTVAAAVVAWSDEHGVGVVSLDVTGDDEFEGVTVFGGLANRLDDHGIAVVPGPGHEFLLPHAAGRRVDAAVSVTVDGAAEPDPDEVGGVDRSIVVYDPLTVAERDRATVLSNTLADRLEAGGLALLVPALSNEHLHTIPTERLADPDLARRELDELAALRERGPRIVAVVVER